MIKAIFFDFDGVIVESVDIKTQAFAKMFEHEDKTAVENFINYHRLNTGVSRYDKFRYLYKEILRRPLTDNEFRKLCNKFSSLVADAVVNAPYVNGALEFLEKNQLKYLFFIVSATPQKEIEDIARKRSIYKYFKKIFGSPKNKSDAVKEMILNEKIKPEEAVYIGDALSDYKAATINSAHFIARVKSSEALLVFDAIECKKIEDLTSLEEVIRDLNT